jgi:phage host-nuclease inhibitor protein Gam
MMSGEAEKVTYQDLCNEIERLTAENARLRAVEDEWEMIGANYGKQVRALDAEIRRIRKAIETALDTPT